MLEMHHDARDSVPKSSRNFSSLTSSGASNLALHNFTPWSTNLAIVAVADELPRAPTVVDVL